MVSCIAVWWRTLCRGMLLSLQAHNYIGSLLKEQQELQDKHRRIIERVRNMEEMQQQVRVGAFQLSCCCKQCQGPRCLREGVSRRESGKVPGGKSRILQTAG